MSPALAEVLRLESLDQPAEPTFPELLDRLYRAKYTGQVTLNFAGGVPRTVVLNDPVQVPLKKQA